MGGDSPGTRLLLPDAASRLGFSELRPLHVAAKPPPQQGPGLGAPTEAGTQGGRLLSPSALGHRPPTSPGDPDQPPRLQVISTSGRTGLPSLPVSERETPPGRRGHVLAANTAAPPPWVEPALHASFCGHPIASSSRFSPITRALCLGRFQTYSVLTMNVEHMPRRPQTVKCVATTCEHCAPRQTTRGSPQKAPRPPASARPPRVTPPSLVSVNSGRI